MSNVAVTHTPTPAPTRADEVVLALERASLLEPAQHDQAVRVVAAALGGDVRGDAGEDTATPLRRRLGEVATYVGIAFVLAAVAVFLAPRWLDLTWVGRVSLVAATAAVLAGVGWAIAGNVGGFASLRRSRPPARLRLVSTLLTGAALAGAAAVGVAYQHHVEVAGREMTDGSRVGLCVAVTLIVLAALAYASAPTLLGQAAVVGGAMFAVPFAVELWAGLDGSGYIGLGYLAVGVLWLALAERHLWRERTAARLVGAALLLLGSQLQLGTGHGWVAYGLTFAVGVAGFLLYLTRRAWPYLVLGVAGVTLAVPEALLDWTDGTLGTAAALLGAGMAFLLSGLVALRIRRDSQH